MNDKKALLGELQLDAEQREPKSQLPKLLITGIGAIALAAAAWFWLLPKEEPISVKTAQAETATERSVASTATVLDASGYVTARRKATVSSKVTGKVMEVYIEEGVVVEENQLLARLDNSNQQAQFNLSKAQWLASESRLEEIKVQLKEAQLDLLRTVELAEKSLASEADLDRTKLAVEALKARLASLIREVEVGERVVEVQQQQLDDTEIRAPFAGVVIAKAAHPGEMISPISAGGGSILTGICTIVDMSSLEIEVDVNESYINRVQAGQPVTAKLNSYQDWEIPAEVITIIPTADRNKATVRVRIAFLETDTRILPDMGVKVSFMEEQIVEVNEAQMTGVFVPESAIASIDNAAVVFVVNNERAQSRNVTVGQRRGSSRNVVSGLRSGEVVVTDLNKQLVTALVEGSPVLIP
ncbi:MAG: efflux RND transporter periplasmic adaptor subunit [Pseudomonadales bacterium]|nr:efflux RND transporter periplasmic adaptor subunit [Pseudomonadales bacterium]MDP7316119.1 efflux RND transporter periplasmic adaptor subunit [Pseudomonadales bacterium]